MSFRLVPKSVTLNDLERRNGSYSALFQRIRVASGAHCVKVHVRYLISWWVLVHKRASHCNFDTKVCFDFCACFCYIHIVLFEAGMHWWVVCIRRIVTWGYLIQMAWKLCRISVCHQWPHTGSSWFRAWGLTDFIFCLIWVLDKSFRPKLKLDPRVRF